MEPEGSLPHSQAPATCPYPEQRNEAETTKKIKKNNNSTILSKGSEFLRGCDEAHHWTLYCTSEIRSVLSYPICLKFFFVV